MDMIWMTVSNDKYEYPELMASSAKELAILVGTSVNTIYSSISHYEHGKIKKSKYQRVRVDEEEI